MKIFQYYETLGGLIKARVIVKLLIILGVKMIILILDYWLWEVVLICAYLALILER